MWASSQIRNGKYIYGKCDEKGFCTFVKHKLYYLTTIIVKMVDHIGVLFLICNWMREIGVGVLKMIKLDGDITKAFPYGLYDPQPIWSVLPLQKVWSWTMDLPIF
jgi:hypothetical protein